MRKKKTIINWYKLWKDFFEWNSKNHEYPMRTPEMEKNQQLVEKQLTGG